MSEGMLDLVAVCADLVGEQVVVDTHTPLIYIGTLDGTRGGALILRDVDVHDASEGRSTKELYIIDTVKFGIKANRREARVMGRVICSVSRLTDVILY
jgi:hypothetical protein